MADTIEKEHFGTTSNGEEVFKFILKNSNNVTVSILNFGCVVYEILLPDKDGRVVDINLGFDNVKDYEGNNNYFGALCGRVANRIEKGEFTLDGKTFHVSKNDPFGDNWVHGGLTGFSRRVWGWTTDGRKLILHFTDPDGSEGMPGAVHTDVTYTLDDDNVLTMDYQSTTSKPTIVDMGSHFMVNLGGHGAGDIRDHVVTVASDKYLEMDKNHLPTGGYISVDDDKVMDFRKPRDLGGDVIEKLTAGAGFCHAYVFDKRGEKKFLGKVEHPASKRYMEVYSTNSTVFVYGNHFMDVIVKDMPCKEGVNYKRYAALEFMPMGYPDSIHHSDFPQSVLRPGETYHETAWYKFGLAE